MAVLKTSRQMKRRMVRDAFDAFEQVFMSGRTGIDVVREGSCVYHAACLIYAAHTKHGVRIIPQAGTAAWPRIDLDRVDEYPPDAHTHFGYEWEGRGHPKVEQRITGCDFAIANGDGNVIMPEMHVWAGRPDTGELIDLTTGYQHLQCVNAWGLTWDTEPLPPWFWGSSRPQGWNYEPAQDATEWANKEIIESIKTLKTTLSW